MFTWDKSLRKLDVTAEKVLTLFKSMRDVQMALPGLSVQQATAYLCQYRDGSEVATVAAFHLQKSQQMAFYISSPARVAEGAAEDVFNEGLNFVESMGFLLSDMDLHLLDGDDRMMLWESLPLAVGVTPAEEPAPAATPEPEPAAKPSTPKPKSEAPKVDKAPKAKPTPKPAPEPEPEPEPLEAEIIAEEEEADEAVDDLLAAVEAMRAKRPGLRARRNAPKPAEVENRKRELRENLGRILSSL